MFAFLTRFVLALGTALTFVQPRLTRAACFRA